jgi:hypothetical protein
MHSGKKTKRKTLDKPLYGKAIKQQYRECEWPDPRIAGLSAYLQGTAGTTLIYVIR